MSENQSLQLAQIRTDGGTQTRAILNAEVIREYAEAMTRGEEFPPIIVFYDGSSYWLADGFHRIQAAQDAGQDEIDAEVRQGTQRDAVLHSVQANATHGLPRSAEDKRRAVMRLLEDDEWSLWADREIARRTKTTHPFVGKLRKEVFGDDVPAERVVERDGQQYTMSTDGINDSREPSAHALAHEYMPRILDMLPDEGLLYVTIRNQLGVRQSNKTQMDALQIALDTLFGQQKLAKKLGRYVVAESYAHEQALGDSDGEAVSDADLSYILAYPVSQLESFLADKSSTDLQQLLDLESAGKNRATAVRALRAYLDTALTMEAILDQLDGSAPQAFNQLRENVYATGHSINFNTALKLLVERNQVEKVGNRYQLPLHVGDAQPDDSDAITDHTPTDEQDQFARGLPDPDATTRAWVIDQLRDGKRHYNMLTRISRTDGIFMRSLLRVVRAMLDNGEIEQDGLMYGLAGDQNVQVLPDDLADEDKLAIRDALVDAVRDEALTSSQINNALHAATGKRLDIHYLITWLDGLVRDHKLITFGSNGDIPRYQLNPTPPTDDDLQQQRAALDLEERLDIARRAIANRSPQDQISSLWLKRAAPLAAATAKEAGELLDKLAELSELRPGPGAIHFEPIEPPATAESTDPGQDGETAVEPAGERVADATFGDQASRAVGVQYDQQTAEANTAIEFSTKFELALFRLDDAFKAVRAIKSIKTWHTLEPRQLESARKAIEMARAWMFNLDGFLADFDQALAQILATGEPYTDLIAAQPVDDTEAVQA